MSAELASKLQLKSDQSLLVINAPVEHGPQLDDISFTNATPASAVLVFITRLEDAPNLIPQAITSLRPDGLLWVAYPKGGSGVPTNVNRDRLALAAEPTGWRPVRMVAVDTIWSAMRLRPADQVGK
jgi:hypothetical protein